MDRRLAGTLLEYFGVEDTALLRVDDTPGPFAAAEADPHACGMCS
jgi:hypothetical protein